MNEDFSIQAWRDDRGAHVVLPSGALDTSTAPQLVESVDGILAEGGREVVLDLSVVDYMDSSGLVAVMTATNRLRKVDGDLRVAAPSTPVRRLLGLTRMDSVFPVFPTREEALDSEPAGGGAPLI